jgi:hypothetical protein
MIKNKTKDGSLSAHIYNQITANVIRMIAKEKGITTQKLISQILDDYIKTHIDIK